MVALKPYHISLLLQLTSEWPDFKKEKIKSQGLSLTKQGILSDREKQGYMTISNECNNYPLADIKERKFLNCLKWNSKKLF